MEAVERLAQVMQIPLHLQQQALAPVLMAFCSPLNLPPPVRSSMDQPGYNGSECLDPARSLGLLKTLEVPSSCRHFDPGADRDRPPPGGPSPTVSVSEDDPMFSLDLTQPVPAWVSGPLEETGDAVHPSPQTIPFASDGKAEATAVHQETSNAFLEELVSAVASKLSRASGAIPGGLPDISQGRRGPSPTAGCALPHACIPQQDGDTEQEKETAQRCKSANLRGWVLGKNDGIGLLGGAGGVGGDNFPLQVQGDPKHVRGDSKHVRGDPKHCCDDLPCDQVEPCPLDVSGKDLGRESVLGEQTRPNTRGRLQLLDVQFSCCCAHPLCHDPFPGRVCLPLRFQS